jgi:hypothetical protein
MWRIKNGNIGHTLITSFFLSLYMSTALENPYPVRQVGLRLLLAALLGLALSISFGMLISGV